MASLSSVIKRDLSGMGKWLLVGALAIMVGGIINVFVGSTAGMMAISVMPPSVCSAPTCCMTSNASWMAAKPTTSAPPWHCI
jgi:FtsH-binding integral membrane protein